MLNKEQDLCGLLILPKQNVQHGKRMNYGERKRKKFQIYKTKTYKNG